MAKLVHAKLMENKLNMNSFPSGPKTETQKEKRTRLDKSLDFPICKHLKNTVQQDCLIYTILEELYWKMFAHHNMLAIPKA